MLFNEFSVISIKRQITTTWLVIKIQLVQFHNTGTYGNLLSDKFEQSMVNYVLAQLITLALQLLPLCTNKLNECSKVALKNSHSNI